MIQMTSGPGRRRTAGVALVAVVLCLVGCSDDSSDDNASTGSGDAASTSTPDASGPDSSGSDASSRPGGDSAVRLEKAGGIALEQVPNSTVTSIESENQGTQWEVQVVTADGVEWEMDVSATDGSVVSGPTRQDDDAEDRAKHQDRVKAAKLDYQEAAEALRAEVPDAKVAEINLDTHRGTTVWEGDLFEADGTKHEVKIDAASGEVVVSLVDDDDDD